MNLFERDPERHIPGRTPMVKIGRKPTPSLKSVTPGYRQRVTQSVRNGNHARMGLKKVFGGGA